MRSNGVTKLNIGVFSVTFMKCQHATKSWESGHRQRCVILGYNRVAAKNIGGSGFVIFINDSHFYRFSMGCGSSTNTRAELLAIWALLRVGLLMGIPLQLIYGDSIIIISWLNNISALDVATLMHWCTDIRYMIHLAPLVIFKHTFREHNALADELSKKALHLDMGFVSF